MSGGNIDRIPVNQLSDRYKLARSAVYKRMGDLGIEREKIGNRAYVSADQVALLDELHSFIGVGGNVAEFIARKGLDKPNAQSNDSSGQSSGLALDQSDMVKLVSAIAAEMANSLQPALSAPVDQLAYWGACSGHSQQLLSAFIADRDAVDGYVTAMRDDLRQTYRRLTRSIDAAGIRFVAADAAFFLLLDLRARLEAADAELPAMTLALEAQRQGHVVEQRQMIQQAEVLEDHADTAAHGGDFPRAERRDFVAKEAHEAPRRAQRQRQGPAPRLFQDAR